MRLARRPLPLAILALAVLAALAGAALALAQSQRSADVQVRVWQRESDPASLYISARPEGGSWATLGTIPLDMTGRTDSGFRYADIELAVPDAPAPAAAPSPGPTFIVGGCDARPPKERVAAAVRASVVRVGYRHADGRYVTWYGNAFHIGGNEYLTAGHVVEAIIEASGAPPLNGARTLAERGVLAPVVLSAGDGAWHTSAVVRGGVSFTEGDVALLGAVPEPGYSTPPALQPRGGDWEGGIGVGDWLAHARAGEAPRWGWLTELASVSLTPSSASGDFTEYEVAGGLSLARTARFATGRTPASVREWHIREKSSLDALRANGRALTENGWSGGPVLDYCARVAGILMGQRVDGSSSLSVTGATLSDLVRAIRDTAIGNKSYARVRLGYSYGDDGFARRTEENLWRWNRALEVAWRAEWGRLFPLYEQARRALYRCFDRERARGVPVHRAGCEAESRANLDMTDVLAELDLFHPCGQDAACHNRFLPGYAR